MLKVDKLAEKAHICKNYKQVVYLWPEIVGQGINRYTTSRWVKNGVLHLHISSSVLRNELLMSRSILIKRLNEAVGSEVIHDIEIR